MSLTQVQIDSDPTPVHGLERSLRVVSDEVNQAGQPKTVEPDNKIYDWEQEGSDNAQAIPKADVSYIPEDPKPAPVNEDGTPRHRSHSGPTMPPKWHIDEYRRRRDEPGHNVSRNLGKLAARIDRRRKI